jgi:hypothetical protein
MQHNVTLLHSAIESAKGDAMQGKFRTTRAAHTTQNASFGTPRDNLKRATGSGVFHDRVARENASVISRRSLRARGAADLRIAQPSQSRISFH